ncbi:Predicted DNA-binding protein, MmcQ/YjbR family [Ligilactobacillus sp. WC1T17]|uniref:Predicted DNA-binding protein, MmcQ/YjbR family n=1 Tax=Ligilactobacillus ruminis TaxID=1623 RepID=A0ABY1AC16_9LACO|nr:Predicted DNA-binding protein, MmcQ/YjbR family [Ligilactobacillus ruminis]
MERQDLFAYISASYGTTPEYLWQKYPNYAVLRHQKSRKWYGIVMDVDAQVLGLTTAKRVGILDVKLPKAEVAALFTEPGIYPAYHMNKQKWITLILNDVKLDKIQGLISKSYELTK